MFVVDKEAKIRALFVMPSKCLMQRPLVKGTEHSIKFHVVCSIPIQGGPQGWTWMGWFITMYPKNLHIFIYPMRCQTCF